MDAWASAPVHALLARMLLKEADAGLLRDLARPEIADAMETLEPGFTAYVARDRTEAELDDLAAEYARLFLMPGGVSPFAAAWIQGDEGTVRSGLESEIADLHRLLEIAPADFGLGNVPADHIGMLLSLTVVALEKDPSGDLAARSRSLYQAWAPGFVDALLAKTGDPLYRAAAKLLHTIS